MSNQTIKIYNSHDFERVTKGVKVAQSIQAKSPDVKVSTDNLDNYVTSETLCCSYCNTVFKNKMEQRLHYKLDWHRYNLKQHLEGLKRISEHDFAVLTKNDNHSTSESKVCINNENPSKKLTNKKNTLNDEALPHIFDAKLKEPNLDSSVETENCDENSTQDEDKQKHAVISTTTRQSKILFENEDGNFFSIYHCLLLHKKKSIVEVGHDAIVQTLTKKDKSLWTIIMVGSGHFAGAVFSDGSAVIHKTLHAYTVRAKQGSAQHSRDNRYSTHCKSAGASLRRANEAHFIQKVQKILKSWSSYLANSSLILYRAVGPHNRSIFFGGKDAPLDKTDYKLRPLPFPTRKPTFKEICRVYDLLNTVEVYSSAASYANDSPASKRLPSPQMKKLCDSPASNALADNDAAAAGESKKKTLRKDTSEILVESQPANSKKKKKPRTEVVKPVKSQKRLLPDIVAKLADISLEADFSLIDDVDGMQDLMESSMSIDLKDCLQEFENTPVPKSRSKGKKHPKSSPRSSHKN